MKAADVIAIAVKELGYYEKRTNAQLDDKTANKGSQNYTKYARDLYAAGYYNGNKNGYSWCDVFVDWCFYMAAGKNAAAAQKVQHQTGALGASTKYSAQYYQDAGAFWQTPVIGAQVFFCFDGDNIVSHTGIVEKIENGRITTIEGNTSDMVARRSYSITDNRIYGYGIPNFEVDTSAVVKPAETKPVEANTKEIAYTVTFRELSKGCTGNDVKNWQRLLIASGFSCGSDGADGDFGTNTYKATVAFQKARQLSADGVVGKNTMSAMWKR